MFLDSCQVRDKYQKQYVICGSKVDAVGVGGMLSVKREESVSTGVCKCNEHNKYSQVMKAVLITQGWFENSSK